MSYLVQSQLETDVAFGSRVRAALTEQALIFKDSQLAELSALSFALLRDEAGPAGAFLRMVAAAPGFAEAVDARNGTIESDQIPDADLLAAVQADFPVVAALYFDDEGTPLG
jgi:hypothetical protein